jgi:hypothetical protein
VDLGGLDVAEFKKRQQLHREAEIGAMRDGAEFIEKAQTIYGSDHFISDAGGSIAELDDDVTLETLADHTLIVYLRPDAALERKLVQRAMDDPKPLYYQEAFLDSKLAEYLSETGGARAADIVPDDFVRWIFPALAAHRRPKYQHIADTFGYTIDASDAESVVNESDFLELIAAALD